MRRKGYALCAMLIALQMVLSCLPSLAFAAADGEEPTVYTELESPAVTYNMNVDWKFKKAGDISTETDSLPEVKELHKDSNGKYFYEVGYDDSAWETVSVPHPINADDSFDGVGVDAGEAGLYRGFMFYRKNITIPKSDAGKKFILEFEAVRQSVYLYVNGEMAGYYAAGITAMGFDITPYIKAGEENLIAVATDNNSDRGLANGVATRETIPGHEPGDNSGIGYQWNTKDFNEVQGGITGNVNLYAKNKVYQTLPLYNNLKTTGNYIYGSNFDFRENSADVTVVAEVRNETESDSTVELQVDVVDMDGNLVDSFKKSEEVPEATDKDAHYLTTVPDTAYDASGVGVETGKADTATVNVTKITASKNISDLKFWSDVSPNLYNVYTYLRIDGQVVDSQKTTTGFREVTYDKDKGLQINGTTTYLKGYAQRSTNEWAAIGVANDWLEDVDMQLIKESNANYIRWMHVAPKPNQIRSGDKYGVISIAPAGDKEGDTTGRAWDQRLEAMRDVIVYYRNSPSVLFYEAGNNQITAAHMKQMTDLRKELDPEGDRRMGCRTINSADQIKEAEWAGTMLYRHDESAYAAMASTGNYIPMLETEYHRNEAPRRVWDDYSPNDYDYVNKWLGASGSKTDGYDIWDQTQEDFSRTMFNSTDGYSYYYNNRASGTGKGYYTGAAMMVWSDSNMHVRNCGVENARTSGRVDAVRIKKESFYAIQAAQSSTPKIHILGHWNYPQYIKGDKENGNYWYEDKTWNGTYWEPNGTMLQRDPTKKTVYVIGSAGLSKVELYVNDTLVGTDTKPDDNYIYAFDNIDVTQQGKVTAKAYDARDEVVAEHEIKTVGDAVTIRLTPVQGPDGLIADGSDLAYYDVEVIDENGNVCPLDDRKINFTISGPGVFLGGYNSGVGDRIVNHKDYVYAECGVNRVFVRSTRDAGDITITASAEGMQPVSSTITSKALELQGGLTTQAQRSFAQGEVPAPPETEKAVSMKTLGETFTADWSENGNVVTVTPEPKDEYAVTVNGTAVTFADKPYKPDTNTGVVGEIEPILAAIKAANGNVSYTYTTEGSIPDFTGVYGEIPYYTIISGDKTVHLINDATDLFVNQERNLMNFCPALNSKKTTLLTELVPVLGQISGVEINTNADTKTVEITVTPADETAATASVENDSVVLADAAAVTSEYKDGKVTVTSVSAVEANVIVAGYDKDGNITGIQIKAVAMADNGTEEITVRDDIVKSAYFKVMIWGKDLQSAQPLCENKKVDNSQTPTPTPVVEESVDTVTKYDSVLYENDCNTAMTNLVLSTDTAPDGTAYYTSESYEVKTGAGCPIGGLGENSTADLMWEADVKFNADGAGITPYSKDNGKLGTCVRRHDDGGKSYISVQKGSSSFDNYAEIDTTKWYHIVLIGRFSAPDAKTDMIVYQYDGSEKTLVGKYENVNQRNMSANNNAGAEHMNVHLNTSIDNVRIVKLGADKLDVASDASEIKAGNTMPFTYSATRLGQYITKPAVTWSVYNADNTAPLNDENITIADGVLNVGLNASAQTITVRIDTESGISATKAINVSAIDISNVKFDALTLTAEKDYVSADEPLTINVAATKDGQSVTLEDSDLIWYVCDSSDMTKLGDDLKWIKVENGVMTVDKKAVTQDVTVRAADTTDAVRGSLKVHIKATDALEGNTDGNKDKLLTANSCETALANTQLVEGAPDGTHAYYATAGHKTANITETNGDVVVEMDIKFNQEGAGFQPGNNAGNVNTCVVYHSGQLCVQTGGSKYTYYGDISSDKWYHITLIRKQGSYAHIIFEEYDDNGNRTNKKIIKDVNQRNDKGTALVNINAGTSYDNIRILSPVPTGVTVSTDVSTVFAGNKVQATAALEWNGLEMKNPDSTMLTYVIYDSENKYPLDTNKITVDGTGLISVDAMADAQDVYVRAVSPASGVYASAKFSIISSDIFTINKIGVNEEGTDFVKLFVTKNFYYVNEVTFVTAIYDKDGKMKNVTSKSLYGDILAMGENEIAIELPMGADFDKTSDVVKVFAVTRVNTDDVTEKDGSLAVTAAGGTITFNTVPTFDNGSKVVVMVLKATADETDVNESDILYVDVRDSLAANDTIKVDYDGDCIVKAASNISGVWTVKSATIN